MDKPTILIVDDEPAMLENCERLLSREGFRCRTLEDPSQVRTILCELRPDVLLLDLRMPDIDGMTVLTVALAEDPTLPVVIMTAYGTVASAVHAISEGAFDYLTKPFTGNQLQLAVQRAVRHRRLTSENRALREEIARNASFKTIVGSSTAMTRLMDQIRKVSPTDTSVLITGESGTGKELLARCVHANSTRKDQAFMPVDCAALPENLLESELFGYERGAFTGANARKKGLLEEAMGSTVFFDEITELSLGLQSKLLRILEERQLRRLGSTAMIDVNIRIVAATNIDLPTAVAEGRFREDLFYRLNVFPLHIPPLRERRGDIVLLAQKFLAHFSAEQSKDPPRVSPDVWVALEDYSWPGNVRELRNVIERLIVMDEDGRIKLADLQGTLPTAATPNVAHPDSQAGAVRTPYDAEHTQAEHNFKAQYLERLLAENGGNVSQAARVAGVSRRTLHRWIADLHRDQSDQTS